MGGLTCKKAKTPLDSYRANVEHCLHACTDCLLAPQTFPLKTHQHDTNYGQRQEPNEDYRSCYKQSTPPCSSGFHPQSLLILYNTFGISHQSNWELL